MIGVVVVTHGQLATELVNAAETIVGDLPNFAAVSIGWHEDVQDARDEIAAAIERVRQPGGVLLATDMFGGTPSNLGITFLEQDKIEIVTGVNLPMLIKAASLQGRRASLTEVARMLREHGRNAIWVASDLLAGAPSPSGVDAAHREEGMMTRECVIRNRLGLHARAAAKFVHTATRYHVADPRQPRRPDDGRQEHHGHPAAGGRAPARTVVITADGADEADAVDALCRLVEGGFGEELWNA